MNKIHTAWRFVSSGQPLYVEEINTTGKGDKYIYTQNADKALRMTQAQCRSFARYMKECDSVAYWS